METQVVLNKNQVAIVGNQQAIATKLETIEENLSTLKYHPYMLTITSTFSRSSPKCWLKPNRFSRRKYRLKKSIGKRPNEVVDAVAASFPLKSTAEVE